MTNDINNTSLTCFILFLSIIFLLAMFPPIDTNAVIARMSQEEYEDCAMALADSLGDKPISNEQIARYYLYEYKRTH